MKTWGVGHGGYTGVGGVLVDDGTSRRLVLYSGERKGPRGTNPGALS
jgi:hypothetical protein